jgi:uroporphyrin-III C-methyltransferase
MATGRVSLVGAGPGDPGLWTVRALQRVQAADLVLYDALVDASALRQLTSARCFCVGKRAGRASVKQETIHRLMVRAAQRGQQVVRLKGGDPYVFGRGGEELAYCRDRGVDVEVVPGITSAISVPAIAGIPLTHRGLATTFTVVTGHDQIRQLGGGRDHTVVLLMGVGTLANSAITLARGERGSDCPVAIVEDGYGPNQRVTVGTLDTIAYQAAVRGVRSPAVVVVGDVVRLSPYAPAELAASAFAAPPAID